MTTKREVECLNCGSVSLKKVIAEDQNLLTYECPNCQKIVFDFTQKQKEEGTNKGDQTENRILSNAQRFGDGIIPEGHVLVECTGCGCFHHIPKEELDDLVGDLASDLVGDYYCEKCLTLIDDENESYSIHDIEFQVEIADTLGVPLMDEEKMTDTIVDVLQKASLCKGDPIEDIELDDTNSFRITLADGSSFLVTVELE